MVILSDHTLTPSSASYAHTYCLKQGEGKQNISDYKRREEGNY